MEKLLQQNKKIGELKNLLLRSKRIEKFKGKRIRPNEVIIKATFNLNNTKSPKYGYSPEQIEEQALDLNTGKYFQEVYDFHRLIKVKENRDQKKQFDPKVDRHKKHLTDPLEVGENVLVLDERLRKKTPLKDCIIAQQKLKAFLTETELSKQVKDQS